MIDQNARLRLGLNIDHVATVRNARGGAAPDPVRAVESAIEAGVDGITAHLREDRRHVRDGDIDAIKHACDRLGRPLNFEMAVTEEMIDLACQLKPHAVCLVPERREERTTEGGLNVVAQQNWIGAAADKLRSQGIRVSLFIASDPAQISAAAQIGAPVIEFHTGRLCDARREGDQTVFDGEFRKLEWGSAMAAQLGIEPHAGHGIDYDTVGPIAAIPQICELNIGHFLIGEAIFTGLDSAIRKMRALMDAARP